jgi:hypothetical protein
MRADDEIAVFDPERMDFVASVALDEACRCMVKHGYSSVLVFGDSGLFRIDAGTMQAKRLGDLPPYVTTAAVTPDGSIYFNQYGTRLYKLHADELAALTAPAADSRKE